VNNDPVNWIDPWGLSASDTRNKEDLFRIGQETEKNKFADQMSPSVPLTPPGADVNKNIKFIEEITMNILTSPQGSYLTTVSIWVGLVTPDGNWDYKKDDLQYADFGNFNYGATGSAPGLSSDSLLRAAGAVQILSHASQPEWGHPWGEPPYGDDPKDQEQIQAGIDYYDFNRNWKEKQ
jgi:hypothetical protein